MMHNELAIKTENLGRTYTIKAAKKGELKQRVPLLRSRRARSRHDRRAEQFLNH